jgi:hypothetical protein
MCAEASTILNVVAPDFIFNCWYLENPSDNRILHISRLSIGNVQEFVQRISYCMECFASAIEQVCSTREPSLTRYSRDHDIAYTTIQTS